MLYAPKGRDLNNREHCIECVEEIALYIGRNITIWIGDDYVRLKGHGDIKLDIDFYMAIRPIIKERMNIRGYDTE